MTKHLTNYLKSATLCLWLIFLLVPIQSFAGTSDLTVGGYSIVSKSRVGRTTYEYVLSASVTNNGIDDAFNVTGTSTSLAPTMAVTDGVLSFGNVPTGTTVQSTDTITVRVDRRFPFDQANLAWSFDASFIVLPTAFEPPSAPKSVQWGDGEELLTVITKEYVGVVYTPVNVGPLFVESGIAGNTPVSPTGHFKAEMNSDATSLLTVVDENGNAYLMKLFPKGDFIKEVNPEITPFSTAVSLIALQPGVMTGEPILDAVILQIIRNSASTRDLSDLIEIELSNGTFKINGDLSSGILTALLDAVDALNHISIGEALALNYADKLKNNISAIFDGIIPKAHAATKIRHCIDQNDYLLDGAPLKLYDSDWVDRDRVCLTGEFAPDQQLGSEISISMENMESRWAALLLEDANGEVSVVDWVPPRRVSIPNISTMLEEIVLTGFSSWATLFNFTDEALFRKELEEKHISYASNGFSKTTQSFPEDGEHTLRVVSAHSDGFDNPIYMTPVVSSFIFTSISEIVVPWLALASEGNAKTIRASLTDSINKNACATRSASIVGDLALKMPGILEVYENSASDAVASFNTILVDTFIKSTDGQLFIGCLLKRVMKHQTVRAKLNKIAKNFSLKKGGPIVALFDYAIDTGNAAYSTISVFDAFTNSQISSVDEYTLAIHSDSDQDGVRDTLDNCPSKPNSSQLDLDQDGIGHACESDGDNDGVIDDLDNCPAIHNTDQADSNLNHIGDVCELNNECSITYFSNLAVRVKDCRINGNGMVEEYYGESGNYRLRTRQNYKNIELEAEGSSQSILHGLSESWHENGIQHSRYEYESFTYNKYAATVKRSLLDWHENGVLSREGQQKFYPKHDNTIISSWFIGDLKSYYSDGKLREHVYYFDDNGTPHGCYIYSYNWRRTSSQQPICDQYIQ